MTTDRADMMNEPVNPLRPMPAPDPESAPFWEGLRERRLLLQKCGKCGRFRFPPGEICPHCHSREASWVPASGRGALFSWIVVRHPIPREVFAGETPYIVALIDLEEGVRIASNLVGVEPEAVHDRMPVSVVFREAGPERVLHAFRPDVSPI